MRDELASRNLDLAFDVVREALRDPAARTELDSLAKEGSLVLYDPSQDELTEARDRMAERAAVRGELTVRVELLRRLTLQPR